MQPLISVIVPVYNVEAYLKRCINSIINQTYKKIEIILVDDGSTDNSCKICDEYKKKDERIQVIHKTNGGLSDARNVGKKTSKGDYICFIDSDDYIETNYIEELYNMCINSETQIAQCCFEIITDNKETIKPKVEEIKYKKVSAQEMIYNSYGKYSANNIIVCNKMFKRELLNGIDFVVGKLHEDEFITYKLIYRACEVAVTNQKLYNYYQRQGSITNSSFNLKRLDYLMALEERLEFFKEKKEKKLYYKTLEQYCYYALVFYYRTKKFIGESEKIQKELLKKYKSISKDVINNKQTKIIKRIVFGLALIFPNIISKILSDRVKI